MEDRQYWRTVTFGALLGAVFASAIMTLIFAYFPSADLFLVASVPVLCVGVVTLWRA